MEAAIAELQAELSCVQSELDCSLQSEREIRSQKSNMEAKLSEYESKCSEAQASAQMLIGEVSANDKHIASLEERVIGLEAQIKERDSKLEAATIIAQEKDVLKGQVR